MIFKGGIILTSPKLRGMVFTIPYICMFRVHIVLRPRENITLLVKKLSDFDNLILFIYVKSNFRTLWVKNVV